MSSSGDFESKELAAAEDFIQLIEKTNCKQIIYLSSIVNEEHLYKHLHSRLAVEYRLNKSNILLTVFRAGIIVGSGSASSEIISELVQKPSVMITTKWLNTQCQPIAVRNVIEFFSASLLKKNTYPQHFDIIGLEVLSYRQMLLQFVEVSGLKRWIFILPVIKPRLSSYWRYSITSTSYPLAVNLVNGMKINIIAMPNNLAIELEIKLLTYKTAVQLAFEKVEQTLVFSSWKDFFSSSNANQN